MVLVLLGGFAVATLLVAWMQIRACNRRVERWREERLRWVIYENEMRER